MSARLNTRNHDRDAVGMRYVYPVISRRSGGVSIGINLNPNNACNWHCAYCQVPHLVRGTAPPVDLPLLRSELETMLKDILEGEFLQRRVPEQYHRICDVAISGNGEPTSCKEFDQVVSAIIEIMRTKKLQAPLRLITNGSYLGKAHIRRGLAAISEADGEIWIKVDSASEAGIRRINGIKLDAARLRQQVETAARLCPTWIQSCMLAWDGEAPGEDEIAAYLAFLAALKKDDVPLRGVLLYGLARPSQQPESVHLAPLKQEWLEALAVRILQLGIEVRTFL